MATQSEQRYVALVDLDAFYASVEVLAQPELAGKPLLIGGSPEGRGVVAAASYEARAFGCHSAMPMARALRLCPEATILHPRFHLYRDYSKQVMDILRRESPLVEQMSIDEAYVDLTPSASSMAEAEGLAHRMQGRVRVELGLPASVGLATSKMVAKVACETGKPNGFVIVQAGTEASFLSELKVDAVPGIGPQSMRRLQAKGFQTLGEVAQAETRLVIQALGPWGAVLQQRASGFDPSPIRAERETKSMTAEETFATDVGQEVVLQEELARMSTRLGESLDKKGMVARTITLKLRSSDFTTITRAVSREQATANGNAILEDAMGLLTSNWEEGRPIRLIGVGVSNLRPVQEPGQLTLGF